MGKDPRNLDGSSILPSRVQRGLARDMPLISSRGIAPNNRAQLIPPVPRPASHCPDNTRVQLQGAPQRPAGGKARRPHLRALSVATRCCAAPCLYLAARATRPRTPKAVPPRRPHQPTSRNATPGVRSTTGIFRRDFGRSDAWLSPSANHTHDTNNNVTIASCGAASGPKRRPNKMTWTTPRRPEAARCPKNGAGGTPESKGGELIFSVP